MKKNVCILLLICLMLVSCANEAAENSKPELSEESVIEEASVPEEPSVDEKAESESSELSEVSEEQSQLAVPTLEAPTVYGCTKLYDKAFVIMGNCGDGYRIFCKYDGKTESTMSDHGYFSVRVESLKAKLDVELWAEKDGEVSNALLYTARPKAVAANQWKIIAGKDYQFHLDYCLNDFLHNNLYSASQISSLASRLETRQSQTSAELIYIVVPSPATVYPETMPEKYVQKQNGNISRLDQVMGAFEAAGITYINVKALFEKHKNDEYKLYWKTDSHWSEYGAFLVYTELFDYISKKYPEAKPHGFDEYEWLSDFYYGGDMSYYLEYYGGNMPMKEYNVLRKPKYTLPSSIQRINRYVSDKQLTYDQNIMPNAHTITTNRPELPSAIVMRDSYSTQLFDILAGNLNKTVYRPMWSFTFNQNEVKSNNADYVIYILTERNLDSVFN